MNAFNERFNRVDAAVVAFMQRWGTKLLRGALAVVFIWFGLLKLFRVSPVADLVADTVYWFSPEWFVPFLGFWETVVGLGLLFGKTLRFVLLLFFMQMAGTFLVLIVHPALSFQNGNPLHLTVLGEFVVKNLVLIAAGLVVGAAVRRM
ncbi:MAG: YkgB family protein [candidate division Zixibacteria bacterium]|nr:YkgB family protein [candidate division Zixibacteria bacterium]MCI0596521.1 YkgB family protein [candidate division Zixibacteria bacterium]